MSATLSLLNKSLPIVLLVLIGFGSHAQDSIIHIKGTVVQHPPIGFGELMIINITSGRGVAGGSNGSFEININQGDELKIFCTGFKTVAISFKDSVYKPMYHITVEMRELLIIFDKPVIVRPQPTYDDLEEAKSKIGTFHYEPLLGSPAAGIFNPITALYQAFSRKEQEKQIYAELLNQKQLEDALRDITRYHINAGLFDLEDDELELFLATCPMGGEFVKRASLYEVSAVLQSCYNIYRSKRRY